MKLPIASIVLGPLLLIGAPPAAGQPVADETVIQTVATADSSAGKETYRQRVDAEMLEWKRQLHGFTERWKSENQGQVDAAEARLHVASESEARKLQVASAEGWDRAKAGFERSSHEPRRLGTRFSDNAVKWQR